MAAHAHIIIEDIYLLVETKGEIQSFDDAIDYIAQIVFTAQDKGIKRILADERNLDAKLEYYEIIEVADYWYKMDIHTMGLRIATLPPENDPTLQKNYETLANNRSMTYRTFESKAAAVAWLKQS